MIVLRQLGNRSGNRGTIVRLNADKIRVNEAVIKREDTGEEILRVLIDKVTGQVQYEPGPVISAACGSSPQESPNVSANSAEASAAVEAIESGRWQDLPDFLRPNWWVEEDTFYIKPSPSHPDSTAISLDIYEDGPLTPSQAHTILGQHEMLFMLALGIKMGKHTALIGPTGIGKTTAYRWLAKMLGYNFVLMPISRGTEAHHLVGGPLPVEGEVASFQWSDGPVTTAVRASQTHPTILVLDEINRIGSIAELARLYSLLDDSRILELSERRFSDGSFEVLEPGELFVGATANPADDSSAIYVGTQELDPALSSRFAFQPKLGYPEPVVETAALCGRVPDLPLNVAEKMVDVANRIRQTVHIQFPISFRELEAWALCYPYMGYEGAAEATVISKAPEPYREDIRNILTLQGED